MRNSTNQFSNCCSVPVYGIDNTGKHALCSNCHEHCEVVEESNLLPELMELPMIQYAETPPPAPITIDVIQWQKKAGHIEVICYREGWLKEEVKKVDLPLICKWANGKYWFPVVKRHFEIINDSGDDVEIIYETKPYRVCIEQGTSTQINDRRKHQFLLSITTKIIERYINETDLLEAREFYAESVSEEQYEQNSIDQ